MIVLLETTLALLEQSSSTEHELELELETR